MADFLGHSNDLIILSLFLSQVPTYNSISFMYRPRGRVNIRLSLQSCNGGRMIRRTDPMISQILQNTIHPFII